MHYTCPEKECEWKFDGQSQGIFDILAHEKTHYKEIEMVEIEVVKKCEECKGTGFIKEKIMVDKNELPETD